MPHIHDLYDFTVATIIVYKDRVLFVNHPRYNKWLTPGGHIELDEDPEQALFREVEEETGLPVRLIANKPDFKPEPGVKLMPQPTFMDVHEANPPHKHIGLGYVLIAEHDRVKLSDEHLGFAWLTRADLAAPEYKLPTSLQHYAAAALDMAKQQ